MNWYRRATDDQWRRFPPNRQREFPFMHKPGYNRKADPYMEFEDPFETDRNIYHVTTNLQGVIASERLKSRRELGDTSGLGGGPMNVAAGMVSVTYSRSRALQIYSDIKFMCELVDGRVPASQAFFSFDFDESNDRSVSSILNEWIDYKDIKTYLTGRMDKQQFKTILDSKITGGEQVYKLWQRLEQLKAEIDIEIADNSLDGHYFETTGFTAPYGMMIKIDPSQVAILQLVARKGAKAEYVPMELELRFHPEDLKVVRIWQP